MSYPDPPTNIQLTPGDASILVTWTAPQNIGNPATFTGYDVCIFDTSDINDTGTIYSTTQTSYTFTNLVNDRLYEVNVSTTNSGPDGGSDPSARVSGTPAAPPPSATVPGVPAGVQLTPGNGSIEVSWSPPENDGGSAILSYKVYVYDSEDSNNNTSFPDVTSPYTISSLVNDRNYIITVSATNGQGEGAGSTGLPATPTAPAPPTPSAPDAPGDLELTPGDASINVSWTAPNDNGSAITSYKLSIYSSDGGVIPSSATNNIISTGTVGTSLLIEGLTNGKTYDIGVSAVNGVGEGPSCVPESANPVAPPVLTLLPATSENNTFTPSWTFDDGAGNTATYYYKVSANSIVNDAVAGGGDQFAASFPAGQLSFQVQVYSDAESVNLVAYESSTVTIVNGSLTLTGSTTISPTSYMAGFSCVISNDTSFDSYLTSVCTTYRATFADSTDAELVVTNSSQDGLYSFATNYDSTFSKAGPITATFSVYDSNGNELGVSLPVSFDVSGINASIDTSVPRKVTVNWGFYDVAKLYNDEFTNVAVTLTVTDGADTREYVHTNANASGSVTFEAPASNPLGMRAALGDIPALLPADVGKPFTVSVEAQKSDGSPLVAFPSALSSSVPDYPSLSASAQGGINSAIAAWTYNENNSGRGQPASYTVEFNNTQAGGVSPSFTNIPPTDVNGLFNLFGGLPLAAGTYNPVVTAVFASGDPLVSSPAPITIFAAPTGFGTVTGQKGVGGSAAIMAFRKNVRASAASSRVDVSWTATPDLSSLSGSYDISQDVTVRLDLVNSVSDRFEMFNNQLQTASISNVADGDYDVSVSQNLVGAPFGGLNFSDYLIQTNMSGRLILRGTAPQPGGGAALNFQRPHSATVSQEVQITLIGEEIPSETADQTLAIKVGAADLVSAFTVTPAAGWDLADLTASADGVQAYPAVTFSPPALLTAAFNNGSTVVADFQALESTGKVDDNGAPYSTLQDYIATMNNNLFTSVLLNSIPVEAVRTVNNVDLTISGSISALFVDQTDAALTTDTSLPSDKYALHLFAQAVGAGKVSSAGAGHNVQFDFAVGDSVSLFVDYTLTKTRKYLLDGNVTAAKFTIGGIQIDTTVGTGNNSETSSALSKRVEFKFTAM